MCKVLLIIHCRRKYVSILYGYSYSDVVSVKYWRDLEMFIRGPSRSLKMVPIDRSHTCCSFSVVTVAIDIACIVWKIKRDRSKIAVFHTPSISLARSSRIHSNFFPKF